MPSKKFKRFAATLFILISGGLVFISPIVDPLVGLYDDIFAPNDKFHPLMLDIPIKKAKGNHEQTFQLSLRRDYGLTMALILGEDEVVGANGFYVKDHDTLVSGKIQIISEKGKVLLSTTIPSDYKLEWGAFNELLSFSFRDVGRINSNVKLVITNLKIEESAALKSNNPNNLEIWTDPGSLPLTLNNLRLRFEIKAHTVFLH